MAITLNGTTGITTPDVESTADISVNGLTVGRGAGSVASNTAVGASALAGSNSGSGFNVGVGYQSLFSNTTGERNSSVGVAAMYLNTTGSYNTVQGMYALYSNTTASNNTAVGYQAGYSQTVADYNTFIGYKAGFSTTGEQNTFLGKFAGNAVTTGSLNTIIGAYNGNQGGLDIRTSSNNIVLSDGGGTPRLYDRNGSTYSPSIYNVATSGGSTVSIGASHLLFRNTSSLRYKKNVVDTSRGLSDVMKLRAVQYESKSAHEEGRIFGGLIAEEIHDAGLTEFVEYNSEGQPDAVHYANMVSLAFKAIQELKSELDTVKAELATLKGN